MVQFKKHVALIGLTVLIAAACQRNNPPAETFIASKQFNFPETPFLSYLSNLESQAEGQRDSIVRKIILEYPKSPVIENDSIVSLFFYGKARQVLINGDLQHGWSFPDTLKPVPCSDSTFFHITYIIPVDARLDYQFIIDSTYTTDPRNPTITPSGYGPHSEIAMPGFIPDPARQFRENIPHGTLDSILLSSHNDQFRPRLAKIYLPPGYEKLQALPVLYVMDGLEALEYMSYPTVMDNLIADGRIGPMIAVFIPPGQRHSEYIGDLQPAFTAVICDEYVPMIDNKYKTAAQSQKRGIAGISSGGHMALITVLSRPDVFIFGAGQSPTLTAEIYKSLNEFKIKDTLVNDLSIYLDVGHFDLLSGTVNDMTFPDAVNDFHSELQKSGIDHVFKAFNDGHEWANWRERTDDILVYFFGCLNESD